MRILSKKKPIDLFCEASTILNEAVIHTLGPKGTNTAIQNDRGMYEIINDGKTIIEKLTSLEPDIAPAMETLKQASFETNRKAGDGTTSTTVIMNALLQGAKTYLEEHKDISEVELRNILDNIKAKLLLELDNTKQEIKEEDYIRVAEVALGDSKYADMIADCYKFLNKGSRPTLIKTDIPNIEVEKIDGICLNKTSIVSSLFTESKEFNDIDIIILFEPVNRFQELTQLLRKVQQTGKTTFLFYNQLSTDILENILFNYTNGAIKLIPIAMSGYGKGTFSVMEDLADYTGTEVIDNTRQKLTEISKIFFGHVDLGILNSEQIILKNHNQNSSKKYVQFEEKSIIIHIGGTNIVEREEVYRRIEDAINSLGNAIDYGIVPGAGETYHNLMESILSEDSDIPTFIISAMNLIKKLVQDDTTDLHNIYDSAMVTKEVIENSFSIVSQVITTKEVIHENIR